MNDLEERVAEAIMKVETEDKISDYYKFARAAIEEITKNAEACGVCGCAVYKDLPTSR